MKTYIRRLFSNNFFKNVSTLALGSIVTQIIVVLGVLALARIYTAEEFGYFTLFMSLVTILAIFTTGRYEYAIQLPENDGEARSLTHLIWMISFLVSVLYLLIIFVVRFFDLGKYTALVHSRTFFLFPVYTFFVGVLSSLQYWNLRNKKYRRIAKISVTQAVVSTSASIILGLLAIKFGLIAGAILGLCTAVLILIFLYRDLFIISDRESILASAKKFISFPKYMLFSDTAVSVSQQFMPIIFTSLFSSTVVGYYSMANRLLKLPSIIITSSISDVFKNESIDRIRIIGNCADLYKKTFKRLISIALPIYGAIFLLSPFLFRLFLGESWIVSGNYAQILCLVLFFEFITIPLNSLFYIFEKQKVYMLIQVLNAVTGILLILLVFWLTKDVYWCLLTYCVNSVIYHIFSLSYTYKLSKQKNYQVQ